MIRDATDLISDVAAAVCPYCGEAVALTLDPGDAGSRQEYVEGCTACCSDFEVTTEITPDGSVIVQTARL